MVLGLMEKILIKDVSKSVENYEEITSIRIGASKTFEGYRTNRFGCIKNWQNRWIFPQHELKNGY